MANFEETVDRAVIPDKATIKGGQRRGVSCRLVPSCVGQNADSSDLCNRAKPVLLSNVLSLLLLNQKHEPLYEPYKLTCGISA